MKAHRLHLEAEVLISSTRPRSIFAASGSLPTHVVGFLVLIVTVLLFNDPILSAGVWQVARGSTCNTRLSHVLYFFLFQLMHMHLIGYPTSFRHARAWLTTLCSIWNRNALQSTLRQRPASRTAAFLATWIWSANHHLAATR